MYAQSAEKRRDAREKSNCTKCYCVVRLSHGFIGFEAEVLDFSAHGLRLRISYQPSILEVIHLTSSMASADNASDELPLTVKWRRQADGYSGYEIGCLAGRSELELRKYILRYNQN